ncbi:MAG: M56 family metallopeptidase, partial [Planctomycetota bacterium]
MSMIFERFDGAGQLFVNWVGSMLLQSSLLILFLFAINFLLRNKIRAVIRYWLCVLILIKLVLPTSLSSPVSIGQLFDNRLSSTKVSGRVFESIPLNLPIRLEPQIETAVKEKTTETSSDIKNEKKVSESAVYQPSAVITVSWPGVIFIAWCFTVILLVLLLFRRSIFVRKLVLEAKEPDASTLNVLSFCTFHMGVKRNIRLKLSTDLTSPSVCGLFRPTILIPENFISHLEPKQLQSILFHELAHINRNDLWVIFFQSMLQIVYFYNPLVWLANSMIRKVREEAVDEMVLVAMGKEAKKYPEILLNISKLAFSRPAFSLCLIGVVESKKALASRIRYIVNRPFPKSSKLGFVNLLIIIVIAAVLLPMAKAELGSQVVQNSEQVDKPPAKQYTFHGNNNSLRQLLRLQKIEPRTLDNPNPLPGDAIVFGQPIRWWSSPWAGENDTAMTAMERHRNFDRFIVREPYRANIWVKYFDVPIDSTKYPLVILTYRASG